MKVSHMPGEFAFKALLLNGNGWKLTSEYYFSQKEVLQFNEGYSVVWPVEEQEGGIVYVPDQSELS